MLARYGMRFDEQAMVGLNGSPTGVLRNRLLEANQGDLDPHLLAQEKTAAVKSNAVGFCAPFTAD